MTMAPFVAAFAAARPTDPGVAPALSGLSIDSFDITHLDATVSADLGGGVLGWAVTQSETPPSDFLMIRKSPDSTRAVTSVYTAGLQTVSFSFSTLNYGTTYWLHVIMFSAHGRWSSFLSASFTTESANRGYSTGYSSAYG